MARQQLSVGRKPPIEVARADALVTATRLALSQVEARRDQQQNILRSVVVPHSLFASQGTLADLVATDSLSPPPRLAAQAATASRKLQEELLSAETEKFHAGMSTNFAVIQQETYLAQAETTEVAAQAAWKKAEVQLHRALGETLQQNGIELPSDAPNQH